MPAVPRVQAHRRPPGQVAPAPPRLFGAEDDSPPKAGRGQILPAAGGTQGSIPAKAAQLGEVAVVVEDRYSSLLKSAYAPEGFLPDLLARVQIRYPEIPIVFAETRALAEEWTFRWLGAALAEAAAESDAIDSP